MNEDAPELAGDYARAGFARRLGFGRRPALLVIDFVNAYLTPGCALYAGVEGVVEPAARLLAAARAAAVPVIYTRVVYAPGGADGGLFYRKVAALAVFQGHTAEGEIVSELAPEPGELVLDKQYASGFFGTSLAPTLTAAGVDTVIIAGLSTSGCVRATAVDAVQHGFVPVVVREAVGDRDERPHRASLFDLDAKYADVLGVDEVLAYLVTLPTPPARPPERS
ncbi:MAG TPA: isochorismatase family protein [Mycobacteriales bacterium]|nr:isochorismatase family protein [Mycobacteriales bacterium]